MNGYTFVLRCPTCDGRLAHVNGTALGSESTAVARCDACRVEWSVHVFVTALESVERRRARERQRRHRLGVLTLRDTGTVLANSDSGAP